MGRRSGDETRALLLRVGMQMLLERGVAAGVQHIRLQDVLRQAGLTTGAAYRLWADQNDYQRDLAVAMVRLRLNAPTESATEAVAPLLHSGLGGDEVIRAVADAHVRSAALDGGFPTASLDARQFLIALALRTTAQTWPELREASRERHSESIEAFATFYAAMMDAYGLRMRQPLTVIDLAAAIMALSEGFAVHTLEGVDHPRYAATEAGEIPDGQWTLLGLAARAIVTEFTVPISAADLG